ncbi:unnamed protein product [Cylicocyclus nassatus]|uniref:Uncharacterized protein n=1 Tax=Cylicocyclus nassatus TaxID=53992 RepID=A0AA36DMW6_CYLNA|nr:unnamed protein product [Cylicocyclus nassatus]
MHHLTLALLLSVLLVAVVDISQARNEEEIQWNSIKAVRFNREEARGPMDYARGSSGFKTFHRRNPLRRRYRQRVRARGQLLDGDGPIPPRTWGRKHYP